MNVDFPFICDYAQVVADKTNALGIGFDTVYSQKVPVKHPMFHLVVQLRAAFVEAGTKDMEVHLIDAGGVDTINPIISRSAWSLATFGDSRPRPPLESSEFRGDRKSSFLPFEPLSDLCQGIENRIIAC